MRLRIKLGGHALERHDEFHAARKEKEKCKHPLNDPQRFVEFHHVLLLPGRTASAGIDVGVVALAEAKVV